MELVLFQSPWICSIEFPCELYAPRQIHPFISTLRALHQPLYKMARTSQRISPCGRKKRQSSDK